MSVTGKGRIRRSVTDWRGIFVRQQASGLSQAVFCAREGIAPSSFALWKKQLGAARGADGGLMKLQGQSPEASRTVIKHQAPSFKDSHCNGLKAGLKKHRA